MMSADSPAPAPSAAVHDVTKNDVVADSEIRQIDDAPVEVDLEKDDVTREKDETMQSLEWKDGVGVLPGSDLKFRLTDEGDLEIVDSESNHEANDVTNEGGAPDDVINEGGPPDLIIDEIMADESQADLGREQDKKMDGGEDGSHKQHDHQGDIKDDGATPIKVESEFPTKVTGSFYGIVDDTTSTPRQCAYPTECLFCGFVGDTRNFYGRFCSKQCIAKNAGRHKRLHKVNTVSGGGSGLGVKSSKLLGRKRGSSNEGAAGDDSPTYTGNPQSKEPGDLKIKIRLPSSGSPFEKRRKASIVNDDVTDVFQAKHRRQVSVTSSSQLRKEPKKRFSWDDYLGRKNAQAVPENIFWNLTKLSSIPEYKNPFLVGHLMEAVDPMHQSMICLVSVVVVSGYRLRLHFEGYPSCFNFWVNANSPLLFPCGFCESTGRTLSPPYGYESSGDFRWGMYADETNQEAAPAEIFASTDFENKTKFKVNDKLEAVDRKHPTLTCVATVIDVIGHYVLIHFDGWNSDYDYWAISSSNYLRPIGWCEENGKELSPPLGFEENKPFFWEEYLKDHKGADKSAFECRDHGFQPGMKLEVIDRRNPVLLRVATIVECDDYRVKIHFDGWSDMYDDWFDADSQDLHPIYWGSNTEHPLQPPLRPEQLTQEQAGCPIPGCNGLGHVRQDKYVTHHSEFGCPYSPQNLDREPLPDRLHLQSEQLNGDVDIKFEGFVESMKTGKNLQVPKRKRGRPKLSSTTAPKSLSIPSRRFSKEVETPDLKEEKITSSKYRLRAGRCPSYNESPLSRAAFLLNQSVHPDDTPKYWHQHVRILPGVEGTKASDVNNWTIEQVRDFVKNVTGKEEYGDVFVSQEIDGKALLMLTQGDITKVLKLKLGPSVKIYNAVLMFKVADKMGT